MSLHNAGSTWWQCPNNPRCPHGSILHDIDDYNDPSPACCVDGCDCGRGATLNTPNPVAS